MPALDLYAELEAIVDALDAASIEYALCGALALAVHGSPRATKDVDLVIAPGDVGRTKDVLRAVGYTLAAAPMAFRSGITVHRVSRVEGRELLTVDLLEAAGPLDAILATRSRVPWAGRTLAVVSRDALVAMKRLADRPQDRADLAALGEDDGE